MIKQLALTDRVLTDKERKNLAILEAIRKSGPISRTDISRLTEFNIVTVSNYVNHYIRKGLVVEGELDESTGGRKPVLVELNPKAGYIVGAGLNMLNMVGVLVNLEATVLLELKRPRPPQNTEQSIRELADLVDEIIQKGVKEKGIEASKLLGIGVAIPGVIDPRGHTIRWPGLIGTRDASVVISVKDIFEKRFGVPAFVENDANAAVFGEKWLGLDRDVRHMLYMFSGMGSGVLIDGEIYRGASGAAGELGVYSVQPKNQDWVLANMEGLGRWEADVGISRHARGLIEGGKASKIKDLVGGDLKKVTVKEVMQAARDGDAVASQAIEEGAAALGRKIAFLVNLLNPEVVMIGGGIENCGNLFLDAVKTSVKEWGLEEATGSLKIIPSAFGENSVALGVVGIVVREVFAQA